MNRRGSGARGVFSIHVGVAEGGRVVKFGIRTPSLKKRIAARTSWKRYVRHNLGFKAPRGWGWLTNPKKAAYNRVYNRTTVSVDRLFKGGRQRRGTRHDGAALLLVAGIFVVAAAGVYLLVVGAVMLVAWLVRVAAKKPKTSSLEPTATIEPSPPDAEYQPVAPVDPAVFGDSGATRLSASTVFDAWLQHLPKAPRHGADLVRGIETRQRLIGRLTTELEGRRFAWRATPITGRAPIGVPPVDPHDLDPWNPPPALRAASRYVATCGTCNGDGRVACTRCSGAGRTTCVSCAGAGKYYGTAANGAHRLLNCKTCKGKGNVTCDACTRGAIDCPTCGRAKKLECWLEIEHASRQDVQIEPDGEVTKAFPWGHDGAIVPREQIALDARLVDGVECTRPLSISDLPAAVPADWRAAYWPRIQATLQPGERVTSQAFTLLEVPSTEVTYAVHGEHQTVAFEGLRMLAPPPWADQLFGRRAAMLRRLQFVLAALPLVAIGIYGARGSYFVGDRAGGLVTGVVIAAALVAICAYRVLWNATLGRKVAVKWALAAIAPIVAATACAVLAEPTVARARGLIDARQFSAARTELAALGSASDPELTPLWADIELAESLAATTCTAATMTANEIASGLPQRDKAIAHADALALQAGRSSLAAGELERAGEALDCASPTTRDGGDVRVLRSKIAVATARRCLDSKQWECAFATSNRARQLGAGRDADAVVIQAVADIQRDLDVDLKAAGAERDLGRRVDLETTALALWTGYLATRATKAPPTIVTLQADAARDQRALARQHEAEQRRSAAEERRRIAAEERERQRQEAAAAAAEWRSRPIELYCNDGSISGCGCDRSSFRGCCSHHGGMSGCHR